MIGLFMALSDLSASSQLGFCPADGIWPGLLVARSCFDITKM